MNAPASASPLWVLPNRQTFGLVAVLVGMWYAGASQSNGAAYLLCFVLTGVTLVSAIHAWGNLRGARLEAGSIRAVFAGEESVVSLRFLAEEGRAFPGLRAAAEHGPRSVLSPTEGESGASGEVRIAAKKRGLHPTLRVRLESDYPLGFFTALRTFTVAQPHYVYPAPAGSRPLPSQWRPARQPRDGHRGEGDDFSGVRPWTPGESQRHIDWKAAARGQPLLTKQWAGEAHTSCALGWELLEGLAVEARLGQLTQWVVQAERSGAAYSLSLPGVLLPLSRGDAHFHACLRALATWKEPSQ